MKIYPNVGILFCRQKCFSTNTIVSLLHEALNFLIIIFHFTAVVPLIPGQSRTSTSSSAPICGDYFKLQSARYEEYINDISSVRTQNSDETVLTFAACSGARNPDSWPSWHAAQCVHRRSF